MVIRIMI